MTCLAPAPTLGSREFVEEFDARHVVVRVLERALAVSRADRPKRAEGAARTEEAAGARGTRS